MRFLSFVRIALFLTIFSSLGYANEIQIRSHSVIDRTLDDPVAVTLPQHATVKKSPSPQKPPLVKKVVVKPIKKAVVASKVQKKAPQTKVKKVESKTQKKVSTPQPSKSAQHPPKQLTLTPPKPVAVVKGDPKASQAQELDITNRINQALKNGENGVEINQSKEEKLSDTIDENGSVETTSQSTENIKQEDNETAQNETETLSDEVIWIMMGLSITLSLFFLVLLVRQKKLVQKIKDLLRHSDHLQQSVDASHIYSKETKDLFKKFDQEIRKPLVIIRESIDQLGQTKLNKQQQEALTKLYESADCLVSMIDQAIDFSKIHHGEFHITQEPFMLSTLFESLKLTHAQNALNKDLTLSFNQSQDIPNDLVGDFSTMEHVLDELISNALAFTSEGEVEVLASLVKEGQGGVAIRFEVKDTGCGIEQNRLDRLMKAPQTSLLGNSDRPSLGVGLAISKALVQALGGAMTAQSSVGKGTVFIVVVTMEVGVKDKKSKSAATRVGKRVVPENGAIKSNPLDPAVISTLRDFISLFEFSPQKVEQLVNKKGFDELRSYLQSIRSICVATHSKDLLGAVVGLLAWADTKGTNGDAAAVIEAYKQRFLELQQKVSKGN